MASGGPGSRRSAERVVGADVQDTCVLHGFTVPRVTLVE